MCWPSQIAALLFWADKIGVLEGLATERRAERARPQLSGGDGLACGEIAADNG